MFHHIVLLRFTPESPVETPRAVVDALRALPSTIPQIRSYDVHLDAGLDAGNAHVSVHGAFDDEHAWRIYSDHPDHQQVLQGLIVPNLEAAVRTQYVD